MKRDIKTLLAFLPLLAGLLLTACEPLSRQLIAAVEDDYSPVIIVDTPAAGGTYYSTIDVSGHVNDDSLASGDDIGLLSVLSFEIASDLAHRGRITISSSGDATKDSGYGNIDIAYNSADRSFSFSVPTSDLGYPPQILYLRITAVDFNGNESNETLQLIRSEGPYIDLTQPSSTTYIKRGSFTVAGTIADSFQHFSEASAAGDPISADEVATLRLEIPLLGVDAELDVAAGETTVSLFPRTGSLDYIPGSRAFQSLIDLNSGDDAITSLTISVTASDLNGNQTIETHSMTQEVDLGPVVYIFETNSNYLKTVGDYYYTGNPISAAQPILYVNGSSRTRLSSLSGVGRVYTRVTNRYLAVANLQFSSGSYNNNYNIETHPNTYVWDPLIYLRDIFDFDIPLAGSTFNSFDGNGTAEITITAVDDTADALSTTLNWIIREDSDGPVFSSMAISASNGSVHVGIGQTVTLSFNVSDGSFETGFDPTSLTGSVAGIALSSGDFVDGGGGSYSVDVDLAAATQSSGLLDISITAEDYIGNPSSLNESDFDTITFYEGSPSITAVSIAADAAPTDAAKPGDSITVTITADQDLDPTALAVEIAGVSATIGGSGTTLTATATIPGAYNTSPVDFEIISFENMVGTAGTLPANPTTTTDSSEVDLYVGPPTLDTRTVTTAGGDRYAASGEIITVSITSSQPLDHGPAVDIGGNSVTATGLGTSWTATTSDPSDGEGTVALSFSDIENIVGTVVSGTINDVTSGSLAVYYPGKPTLTGVSMTLDKAGADPAVGDTIILDFSVVSGRVLDADPTVTFSSGGSLTPVVKDGGTSAPDYKYKYTLTSGDLTLVDPISYTIDFTDAAGTAGDQVAATSTVDLTP